MKTTATFQFSLLTTKIWCLLPSGADGKANVTPVSISEARLLDKRERRRERDREMGREKQKWVSKRKLINTT